MTRLSQATDINKIICDERCQPRAVLNPEAVQEYAEIYKEGGELPALEVVDVDGDLVLIDGFHRLAGARQADHGFIRVVVVEEADIGRAAWLAAAANQKCGVRRSNLDKRQAVTLALQSDVGQEQSLRVIAEHVGVHHQTVANIKNELSKIDSEPEEETEPQSVPDDDEPEKDEPDIYHTASKRILTCYKKVLKILGENDVVCEALYIAYEKAQEREL